MAIHAKGLKNHSGSGHLIIEGTPKMSALVLLHGLPNSPRGKPFVLCIICEPDWQLHHFMVCSYYIGFQPSPLQNITDENHLVSLVHFSNIEKESIFVSVS